MSNQSKGNVIQFPSPKKPGYEPAAQAPLPPAKKPSALAVGGGIAAVILMTVAVNKYTFDSGTGVSEMASLNATTSGRKIASVQAARWSRDAQWEKRLADRLASAQVRQIASTQVGREATKQEQLRWGILEEKYTIVYSPENKSIHSIVLQDPLTQPSYILNRDLFLNKFGELFESDFSGAKLKSVEKGEDKTIESYTLFNKEKKATGEARFELDRHKRLLSLKVEPIQI